VKHVAIDLGGRESQICVRDATGAILDEKRHPTRKLEELLAQWEPRRVIVETSAEAFRIADAARAAGHEVRVVPATLVRTLGVGARGVKNDQRDARTLSEVSCRIDLPSVHIPSTISRELKSLCGSRDVLVSSRTSLVNNVRGWMRTQLWRIRPGAATTFTDRVRAHAKGIGQEMPTHIDWVLRSIEALTIQISAANNRVKELVEADLTCRRMMTVPGVGQLTALRFLATLDDINRFPSAHAVQSYLGITPGENSSSDKERKTGITKAGPSSMRHLLIQSAWAALRSRPTDPMVLWATRIAQRRGRFVAIVALARKIAGVLFALWRDGSEYRSTRSAQLLVPTP
jgi:transposase